MHPEMPGRSRAKTLIRADKKKMPVHTYGGSIPVNATRMFAAGGKIKIAPGNAEAK